MFAVLTLALVFLAFRAFNAFDTIRHFVFRMTAMRLMHGL